MATDEVRKALREHGLADQHLIESQSASVSNLRRVWNYYSTGRKAGAANLMRSRNTSLEGVALQFTKEGLRVLDKKEGFRPADPSFSSYIRRIRSVRLNDGTIVRAWVYKAAPQRVSRSVHKPRRAYVEVMLRGAREHRLSNACMEEIQAIETID